MSSRKKKKRRRTEAAAPAGGGAAGRVPATEERSARGRWLSAAGVLVALALAAAGAWWWSGRRPVPPSLLLITIDTLRADHVGAWGRDPSPTPRIDALAARGTRFARTRAAAPVTAPSHATLLTGRYPPEHGVRDNVTFHLGDAHPTLARLLRERGYRTGGFVGAFPVAGDFGFAQGFEQFDDEMSEVVPGGISAERRAGEVVDAAVGWLRGIGPDDPFFAWVHLYDPHEPYVPPEPFAERWRERPYDGEIAYADSQIGRLFAALEQQGRSDTTVVAVLSDHGEGLGEHGEAGHGVLAYQTTLAVPFVLAGPGVPAGKTVEEPVGAVDVLPTLLGLVGAPAPDELPGRDLAPALRGERVRPEPQYAESLFARLNCRWAALRVWYDGDWKLIDGARPELFHLGEDPHEEHDRAGDEPERTAEMQSALRAALSWMAPGGDTARPGAISPAQEERLRSLGYAGGGGLGGGGIDDPGLPDPRDRVGVYDRLQLLGRVTGPAMRVAIEEAAEIVRGEPENPFAHVTLATLAQRTGRLPLARDVWARTVELDPDRPSIRRAYAGVLAELGDDEAAERELRIALEQGGGHDPNARVSLADVLVAMGRLDEAEEELNRVLREDPQHREARAARGRLLMARGETAEGLALLQETVQPDDLDTWLEIASADLDRGDTLRARKATAHVLERSPAHPWALGLEGHALVLEGQRRDGVALLERALAARPRRPRVWLDLARGFEAAGETARADQCRRAAASLGQPASD